MIHEVSGDILLTKAQAMQELLGRDQKSERG